MNWLVDECVDAGLVIRLRAAGHDVTYIAEIASGATDTTILQRANDEQRLLLTADKDFGDLVFRAKMAVPGIVLLRLPSEKAHLQWTRLELAIQSFGESLWGHYVVVEENRFRSRPLL